MGGFAPPIPPPPGALSGGLSIGEMMMRAGMARAALAQKTSEDLAGGIANTGRTIGQALAAEPLRQLEIAKGQHELTAASLQEAELRRQTEDRQALDSAIGQLKPDMSNAPDVADSLPGHLRMPFITQVGARQDAQQKFLLARNDMVSHLAVGLVPHLQDDDGGMGAFQDFVSHAKSLGLDVPDDMVKSVQGNPRTLGSTVFQLASQGSGIAAIKDRYVTTPAGVFDPLTQKMVAPNTELKQSQYQGPKGESLEGSFNPRTGEWFDSQGNKLPGPVKAVIPPAVQVNNLQAAAGASVPDAAVDQAAHKYLAGESIPSIGRGAQNAAWQIRVMRRASEIDPTANIVANKAQVKAAGETLTGLSKSSAAIEAFENTAQKNIDVFLNQAKKISDSGVPILNAPLRMASSLLAGSKDQAGFEAARETATSEVGKVLSGASLGGVVSDTARAQAGGLMGPNMTVGQLFQVANILKQDMDNRKAANAQEIDVWKGHLAQLGGSPPRPEPAASGAGGGKGVLRASDITAIAKKRGMTEDAVRKEALGQGYSIQ